MSYSVSGTTITLTRGDTLRIKVDITEKDGSTPYVPSSGDKIRFAMKSKYSDQVPLLIKDIPIDTMELVLDPEDTKKLEFGKYVYDGEYEVSPSTKKDTILETKNKTLTTDLIVKKIQYVETSNVANGKTIYIGEDE